MTALGPLHRLRPYRPATDEGYALVSWVAEAIRGETFRRLDRDLAFRLLRPHVLALLDRLGPTLSVVVPADRDEPIEAFCLVEGPVVHFLYVSGSFRGQGLMTRLLEHHGFPRGSTLACSTDTRDLRGVMAKGLYDIHLRPDLLLIEAPTPSRRR